MSEQTKKNIAVEEAFQKSVNIRYDYGNMAKVQDYIASGDSLELLKTLTTKKLHRIMRYHPKILKP